MCPCSCAIRTATPSNCGAGPKICPNSVEWSNTYRSPCDKDVVFVRRRCARGKRVSGMKVVLFLIVHFRPTQFAGLQVERLERDLLRGRFRHEVINLAIDRDRRADVARSELTAPGVIRIAPGRGNLGIIDGATAVHAMEPCPRVRRLRHRRTSGKGKQEN